mgnify:CR=1 FL=1
MQLKKSIVKGLDAFREMDDDILDDIVQHGIIRSYSRGDEIFIEGRIGIHLFFLIAGDVRIYKTTADGREITITLAGEGEMFGEAILRSSQAYPATAVCARDSILLLLDINYVRELMGNQRFISRFIISVLKRLRFLSSRISYLTSYDIEERFFRFMEERYGRCTECTLDLPKGEIARTIGTIPETFSRLLKRLEKRGDLTVNGRKFTINPDVWNYYIED